MTKKPEARREFSLALALGFRGAYAVRKMRAYLDRQGQSGASYVKPRPHGRAERVAKKISAQLREQERQVALGLHNFRDRDRDGK